MSGFFDPKADDVEIGLDKVTRGLEVIGGFLFGASECKDAFWLSKEAITGLAETAVNLRDAVRDIITVYLREKHFDPEIIRLIGEEVERCLCETNTQRTSDQRNELIRIYYLMVMNGPPEGRKSRALSIPRSDLSRGSASEAPKI